MYRIGVMPAMPTALPMRRSGPVTLTVPSFDPHPWLRGGHAQTVAGRFWPERRPRLQSTYQEIALDDGDRLSVLDSLPPHWVNGDPQVLMVHGLCSCARSPYVTRVGARLWKLGYRVVRMNLRGAGSGFGLSRNLYHSGRSEDVRAVASWMCERGPDSPLGLIGFSLGGNLVLKLAGEAAHDPVPGLNCVLAANPPIDLSASCQFIRRPEARAYDWNFIQMLRVMVDRHHAVFPDLGPVDLSGISSVYEFDNIYTAPRHGYDGAEDYYARCSSGPLLPAITIPGLVVHAEDDPFIPPEPFRRASFPPNLTLELLHSGGHLGFVSRSPWGGDRRWLDARLAAWLAQHWGERRT